MYTYRYEPFDRVFEILLDGTPVREFFNGMEARDYCQNMNSQSSAWRNRT